MDCIVPRNKVSLISPVGIRRINTFRWKVIQFLEVCIPVHSENEKYYRVKEDTKKINLAQVNFFPSRNYSQVYKKRKYKMASIYSHTVPKKHDVLEMFFKKNKTKPKCNQHVTLTLQFPFHKCTWMVYSEESHLLCPKTDRHGHDNVL